MSTASDRAPRGHHDDFTGNLIIIGGAEDKYNERHILRRFLRISGGEEASILIVPVASEFPEVAAHVYEGVFTALGAATVKSLHVAARGDALGIDPDALLDGVTGIFISGGDQARLAAKLGGTPLVEAIGERVRDGLVLAGSSAGAAGMSTSMIVRGRSTPGPYAEGVRLAQGLGILRNIIIDQHFTQRHRLTRLITAVAYNPINLGIGIDEDTAIVVTNGMLEVIGSGTVTIVDGSSISFSDIAEKQPRRPFALCDLRIHILNSSLRFDIHERRPLEYLSEYR